MDFEPAINLQCIPNMVDAIVSKTGERRDEAPTGRRLRSSIPSTVNPVHFFPSLIGYALDQAIDCLLTSVPKRVEALVATH